jgi:c-di-GMP-binding flagellar brake protein YcgR
MRQDSCASREQAQAFAHREVFMGFPFDKVSPSSIKQIQHFFFSPDLTR